MALAMAARASVNVWLEAAQALQTFGLRELMAVAMNGAVAIPRFVRAMQQLSSAVISSALMLLSLSYSALVAPYTVSFVTKSISALQHVSSVSGEHEK